MIDRIDDFFQHGIGFSPNEVGSDGNRAVIGNDSDAVNTLSVRPNDFGGSQFHRGAVRALEMRLHDAFPVRFCNAFFIFTQEDIRELYRTVVDERADKTLGGGGGVLVRENVHARIRIEIEIEIVALRAGESGSAAPVDRLCNDRGVPFGVAQEVRGDFGENVQISAAVRA